MPSPIAHQPIPILKGDDLIEDAGLSLKVERLDCLAGTMYARVIRLNTIGDRTLYVGLVEGDLIEFHLENRRFGDRKEWVSPVMNSEVYPDKTIRIKITACDLEERAGQNQIVTELEKKAATEQ